jgi:hypothetical protein
MKNIFSKLYERRKLGKGNFTIPRADIEGYNPSEYSNTPGTSKIFGIGLSKTGTTSLFYALGLLGYRSITYRHIRRRGIDRWLDGDFSVDYLSDIDAATDLPLGSFYRNLDLAYPGSKFILTTREKSGWLKSVERQFTNNPDPGEFGKFTRIAAYGHRIFNSEEFSYRYDEHFKSVTQYFKNRDSDLLILDISVDHKWQRLLKFLNYGSPPPSVDYPNRKPGSKPPEQALFYTDIFGGEVAYMFTTQTTKRLEFSQVLQSFVDDIEVHREQGGVFSSALIMVDRVPSLSAPKKSLFLSLERIDAKEPHFCFGRKQQLLIGVLVQNLLSKAPGIMIADPDSPLDYESFSKVSLDLSRQSSLLEMDIQLSSFEDIFPVNNHHALTRLIEFPEIQRLQKFISLDILKQKDSIQMYGIYRFSPDIYKHLNDINFARLDLHRQTS